MFSLLLVLMIGACGPITLDPEDTTPRPQFHWLDGHEESIMDGEPLKATVKDERLDIIVREPIYHVRDVQLRVNYTYCSIGYILMYFARRVGNHHYSRLGCRTDLDALSVHTVAITMFPGDPDMARYLCTPPYDWSDYDDEVGMRLECKVVQRDER